MTTLRRQESNTSEITNTGMYIYILKHVQIYTNIYSPSLCTSKTVNIYTYIVTSVRNSWADSRTMVIVESARE